MKKIIYSLFTLLWCAAAVAQTTVSGVVTGGTEPLIGVSVQVAGTTTGTITDLDGRYELTVPAGSDTLSFSYIGFTPRLVAIQGRSTIDVNLSEASEVLQQVVVIGYGIQQKDDLTGAVSVVESEQLTDIPTQSLGQSLQGKVSGLQIIPGSGAPGADAVFRIRGVGTLNDANPLFVVDGMILNDISFLNPQDVQSVSVLKDASATAIYGARGANGVIIISTKQGGGEGSINVSAYTGTQEVVRTIDLLNATEYATLINEADVNEGRQPRFANPEQYGEGTDWQDVIFQRAPIYNAQLSFMGGGDRSTFNLSANYYRQEGIIRGSAYDRFTTRLNNSRQVTDWLNVAGNLSLGYNTSDNISTGNILLTALRADPITVPQDEDGNFGDASAIGNTGNPLASIFYSNDRSQTYRAVGNAYADVTFLEDFTFRTNFGLDFNYDRNRNFVPAFRVSASQQNEESDISVFNAYRRNWLWENTLSYANNFGVHHLDGVVGLTYQDNFGEFIQGSRERLVGSDPSFYYLNSGDVTTASNSGGVSGGDWGLVSYLGRLNYVFDGRYLVTVSGRVDGSSRFGANNQYGFFPSVGLGWNVSQEEFWNADGIISRLKLRASWGQTGNDRIGDYQYVPSVANGLGAVFGNNPVLLPGASLTSLANPDLRWEETTQTDVGLEVGFFNNQLLFEADLYRKVTSGILFRAPIPDYIGADPAVRNVAEVLNRGLDLSASWRAGTGALRYSLGGNASFVHNEVLRLDGNTENFFGGGLGVGGQLGTNSRVGFAAGSFYGYELDGVFQSEEELNQFAQLGNQQVGDLRFRDQNGDGVITAAEDRVVLGSAIPDMILGINGSVAYSGLELSFDLTGQFGNEVINAKQMARFGAYNYEDRFLDRFTGPGSSLTDPRITIAGQNFETLSSRYVEDGSYLRLRNVTLAYRFATDLTDRLRMQSLRVYVSGTNLVTSQEYSGYNPEIYNGSVFDNGIDRGTIYPIARTLTAGLDITF
ncbi:SusC/RagA family TonB-linked outer membrane protein [Neolewinella litorea]|uniref:TonB-dependent receptor n=1 Tax=Neolewinella litorea TaxID=2562452 RepID=A0A4S4NFD9_9BACT|nr:TonB-dependent receptor [Neolewinella litorea]THH37515.1 TonB-dependent receptor [Neolewinella litorea]